MHGLGQRAAVANFAGGARILQQDGERSARRGVGGGADDHFDIERTRARLHDVQRLRKDIVGDEESPALALADTKRQRHRFRRRRGFVEHRGVGDRHARQVAPHRLEIEQRLEPPLRDFRLIRRVRGVPGRVLQEGAQDDARRVRAVVAQSDERFLHLVLRCDRAQPRERLRFRHGCGELDRRLLANRGRDEGVDHRGARREAQRREHRGLVLGRRADVAREKGRAVFQFAQRRGCRAGQRFIHLHVQCTFTLRRSIFRRPPHRAFPQALRRRRASTGTATRRTHRR